MGTRGTTSIRLRRRETTTAPLSIDAISKPIPVVTQFFSEEKFKERQKFIVHHCNACWSLHDEDVSELVPSGTLRELNRRVAEMLIARTPAGCLKQGTHVDGRDNSYEAVVAMPGRRKIYLRYYLKQPIRNDQRNQWTWALEIFEDREKYLAHLQGYPTGHASDTLVLSETGNKNEADPSASSSLEVDENVFYNSLLTKEGFELVNRLLTEALAGEESKFSLAPKSVPLRHSY
jgi:hypothetical protein